MPPRSPAKPPLRIGLIGFGNVGSGLVRALGEQHELLRQRFALQPELTWLCSRTLKRRRGTMIPAGTQTTNDFMDVVRADDVDVVVELMGGIDRAHELVRAALEAGKDVVTANKALLAHHGPDLAALAAEKGRALLYEAAVGAGIPIIRSIETGLASNRIGSVSGIINGTTNYILTRMAEKPGASFSQMLAEAQRLGYAEADPSLDVDGHDAAQKLCVLAMLCFGQDVRPADVATTGIRHVTPEDIAWGRIQGVALRLLATAAVCDDGKLHLSVRPAFIPERHPIGSLRGPINGVWIEADPMGPLFLQGSGAGPGSTVTGVLSDLKVIADDRSRGVSGGASRLALARGRRDMIPRKPLDLPRHYLRIAHEDIHLHASRIERMLKGPCVDRGTADATYLVPEMPRRSYERLLGKLDTMEMNAEHRSAVELAFGCDTVIDADWKR